jgi:hypothetical protein
LLPGLHAAGNGAGAGAGDAGMQVTNIYWQNTSKMNLDYMFSSMLNMVVNRF